MSHNIAHELMLSVKNATLNKASLSLSLLFSHTYFTTQTNGTKLKKKR